MRFTEDAHDEHLGRDRTHWTLWTLLGEREEGMWGSECAIPCLAVLFSFANLNFVASEHDHLLSSKRSLDSSPPGRCRMADPILPCSLPSLYSDTQLEPFDFT